MDDKPNKISERIFIERYLLIKLEVSHGRVEDKTNIYDFYRVFTIF